MTSQSTFIFIPGIGADHRLFKYQTEAFPNSFVAEWIDPLSSESSEQYAVRFAGHIRTELDKRFVFLTNNTILLARLIADLYRSRWRVELFFKWIK
jgi:hypothetical protein